MAKQAESKLYPIQHYVKIILVISFSALILDFIISFASIAIVKQQSARDLRDTANLYINRINSDFSYLNHFMGWTLANDENVKVMEKHATDETEFIKANSALYRRFVELQQSYGQAYNFFLFFKDKNFLLNCAPMGMTYKEYQELQQQINVYIKDKIIYDQFYSRWSTVQLAGKFYLINIVPYHDSYIICLIAADELIRPLRQINLGENGYASLATADGSLVTSPITNNGKLLNAKPGGFSLMNVLQTKTTVIGEFTNASFFVKLVIQFGAFEKIMIAQLLIVLLALIVACSLCFILLYFKNKVLQPIKSFSYNLAFWTEDGEPLDIASSKIVELEKANKQFSHLVTQIKTYKIDIYEREIEKQRIQLDYTKLQIKPHFFLNCLTTIHSMAQMDMTGEIQQMALSTSDYFRYIFQNGQDFVRMEDEIEHVRIYLDIQKNRYRDSFDYRIELAEPSRHTPIPPLVLQTFIENAIKYAVSRDNEALIALTVDRRIIEDEPMTVIWISDTGPGFPPDVLAKLQHGQPLDQTHGTQIGIMNTVQRLEYLYGKNAYIRFSNREGGGACITLYLPDPPANPTEMGA
ncbi:sensor histidine kinase [Paenibacillus rhizovicinus]|uniref:Sensor histidine kinase n=1 Tax=Paenibacillus rhizovicinus TaxID=2704463 RepID=A0A6C0P2R1_9BACL|nr:histidine kinase [Paenibacillus rhizovicinus]QHW32767.1 sensor histidine kinase [Paenibacillus rhizovicinus]